MSVGTSVMEDKRLDAKRGGSVATYGIMALVFVFVGKVQELAPFLSGAGVGKLAMGAALLLYFIAPKDRGASVWSLSQVRYVLAIFMVAVATIPFSIWGTQSLNFVFFTMLKTVLFFLLAVKVVNTTADLRKLNMALALSMLVLALQGLFSPAQDRFTAGATYDPNDLALVLVTAMPMVFYLAAEQRGAWKIGLYAVLALMLYAVIMTVSRGGFLGLITVATVIFFKNMRTGFAKKALLIASLAGLFVFIAPDSYWQRIGKIFAYEEDYNMTSKAGRVEVWKRGLDIMASNPLGVGAGAFVTAEGMSHADEGGKWSAAHNSFIQVGAELGVAGLGLFIALVASTALDMRRLRKRCGPRFRKNNGWAVDGTEVAVYGFCVTGFFLSQAYASILFLLVANCAILKRIERLEDGAK